MCVFFSSVGQVEQDKEKRKEKFMLTQRVKREPLWRSKASPLQRMHMHIFCLQLLPPRSGSGSPSFAKTKTQN